MKATPAKQLIPLHPVKEAKEGAFLQTLFKGYLIAQCLGLITLLLITPTCTMGATTRGKVDIKTRYLTSQSTNLQSYGFERMNHDNSKT